VNDRARGMKTVPVLFGMDRGVAWVVTFSVIHVGLAVIFLYTIGTLAWIGFIPGFILLAIANQRILRDRTPEVALGALPLFHASLLIYALSLIVGSLL
jgi:geranylgeranylglycerol-phosphate geranylgeranyltransferase